MRDQISRTRGHRPVRQLIQRAHGAIKAIKPCFLMSPMTVAQTLEPTKHFFDLVIFDEASQLTCEDALGAIVRGKQLVVVGDPKQLPPTNFFAAQLGEIEATTGEDGEQKYDDLESVLELAQAAGFHGAQLRWHYRSRHESLIAYSNRNFYDSSLLTFPSSDRAVGIRGLSFEYVKDAHYEGKGTNTREAESVVEAVAKHAREAPTRSLCVGTFSLPQQHRVQDLLERARRHDPRLDEFLSQDKAEPFFVKNLESIQGDERDVVFLSVTYGPGADGRIRYNFGPLNGQSGWRRLNVLTTRAREQMRVFSCMRAEDMAPKSLQSPGPVLLRDFLHYAETGKLEPGLRVDASADFESPLEEEVAQALQLAGIDVQPQVGVSGYHIDFGIADPSLPGRFVCGIECDGATYHSAESARDRDRLREEVLRGLGWELHRVWSTDWWRDPAGQTRRLLKLIAASTEDAKSRSELPPVGANATSDAASASRAVMPASTEAAFAGVTGQRVLCQIAFAPYRLASPSSPGGDLVDSRVCAIGELVLAIVEVEGPVHVEDLKDRVVAAFGHRRAGARITTHLDSALESVRQNPVLEIFNDFWSLRDRAVVPRERTGTGIRPERIAQSEYIAAVLSALRDNETLNESELEDVVNSAFGYGNVTSKLRQQVRAAAEALRVLGQIGIASNGYTLIVPSRPSKPALSVPESGVETESSVIAIAAPRGRTSDDPLR